MAVGGVTLRPCAAAAKTTSVFGSNVLMPPLSGVDAT